MTDHGNAWYADVDPGDVAAAAAAVADGRADEPADWPSMAVDAGVVADREAYDDALHDATIAAARDGVAAAADAPDRDLLHAVRALEDCQRQANELGERVDGWARATGYTGDRTGLELARALAIDEASASDETNGTDETSTTDEPFDGNKPIDPDDYAPALQSLARRATDIADEAERLRESIEALAPAVTPNLAALAGPILAARLVALAGGLEDLARSTSGTVQLLGAEDALFAHLQGSAPSPKHGVIYTHDAIQACPPDHRGSAARALAGKLAIAARVDHYSGERKPSLDEELAERIDTIHARGTDGTEPNDDAELNEDSESGEDAKRGEDEGGDGGTP